MTVTANQLTVLLFDAPAGGYSDLINAYLFANGEVATASALLGSAGITDPSNAVFAYQLAAKLTGGTLSQTDLNTTATLVQSYMSANPTLSRGQVVINFIDALETVPTTDPMYGAARVTFDNQVTAAVAYTGQSRDIATLQTVIASVTSDPATIPVVSGQSFILTTGQDVKAGGAGNDLFDASVTGTGAQTLNTADGLTGGSGTDTLTAGLASGTVSPTLNGIEIINVTPSATATLNLLNATGVTAVNILGGSGAAGSMGVTIDNIPSAATTLEVNGSNYGATFNFANAALAGTADNITIELLGVQDASTGNASNYIVVGQDTGTDTSGAEVVTLNSTSSANKIAGESGGTKLVITGDQALTITTTVTHLTQKTIDASANTGGVTLSDSSALATITGGSANDTFTLSATSAGKMSITGGGGNDSFTFTTATSFGLNDTIDGGAGTDTLTATTADFDTAGNLNGSTVNANVIDMEKLVVSNVTVGGESWRLANLGAAINSITLQGGTGGADGITANSGVATTVAIGKSTTATTLGGTLTVTAAGSGTSDAVTVSESGTTAAPNGTFNNKTLAFVGEETVTVTASAPTAGPIAQVINGINLTNTVAPMTIKFTGSNKVTTGTIQGITQDVTTLDASTMTGDATTGLGLITTLGANPTGAGWTATGSTASDTITGSTGKDSISGAAGNDSIASGGGNDTISGGAGNDTINISGGAATNVVNLDGGTGNDVINIGANLNKLDSIAGGDNTDTLQMTNASVTIFDALTTSQKAALAANISGIEKLELSDALASQNLDLSLFSPATTYVIQDSAPTGGAALVNLASGSTVELRAATSTATNTVLNAAGGSADSLTFKLNFATDVATDFGTETLANVETVTVNSTNQTTTHAAANTLVLNGGTSLTSVVVTDDATTGGQNLVLTLTGGTKIASVDASAFTGTLSLNASASTVADNIKGGSGTDNTLTGGTGADTITGGAFNDTINGGSGADSLVGGAGNDVFVTSSGNDTIDGGSGTNKIQLANGLYNDITGLTISNVTALDMNSFASTMSTAQYAGLTSITNGTAGVTFTDAGTITGSKGVDAYTLANGTNTFTSPTVAQTSAAQITVTGGTGADTFNFTAAQLSATTKVTGGAGSDQLNITDNTSVTLAGNAIVTVEKVTFANTDTNISFVTGDGMDGGAAATITIDASALSTGTFNFVGTGETTGATSLFKVIATNSSGNETLLGGSGADIISGGSGLVTMTGAAGIDTLIVGTGTTTITDLGAGGLADILQTGASGTVNATTTGAWTASASTANNGATVNITTAAAGTIIMTAATGTTGYSITNSAGVLAITGSSFADTIVGGTAGDTLTGGNGNDTITLGAAGQVDSVILTGSALITTTSNSGGMDTINNTFSVAEDVISFGSTWLGVGFGSDLGVNASGVFSEVDFANSAVDNTVDGSITIIDGNGLSTANTAATIAAGFNSDFTAAMSTIIVADNGTDTQIWYVNNNLDGTSSTTVASTEVVLIGTVSGELSATFTSAAFGLAIA